MHSNLFKGCRQSRLRIVKEVYQQQYHNISKQQVAGQVYRSRWNEFGQCIACSSGRDSDTLNADTNEQKSNKELNALDQLREEVRLENKDTEDDSQLSNEELEQLMRYRQERQKVEKEQNFVQNVLFEATLIQWPKFLQALKQTGYVIAIVVLASGFVFGCNTLFNKASDYYYKTNITDTVEKKKKPKKVKKQKKTSESDSTSFPTTIGGDDQTPPKTSEPNQQNNNKINNAPEQQISSDGTVIEDLQSEQFPSIIGNN